MSHSLNDISHLATFPLPTGLSLSILAYSKIIEISLYSFKIYWVQMRKRGKTTTWEEKTCLHESCVCIVKDAAKCSFEYLSEVHHTRRQHNVGVGEGAIIK